MYCFNIKSNQKILFQNNIISFFDNVHENVLNVKKIKISFYWFEWLWYLKLLKCVSMRKNGFSKNVLNVNIRLKIWINKLFKEFTSLIHKYVKTNYFIDSRLVDL